MNVAQATNDAILDAIENMVNAEKTKRANALAMAHLESLETRKMRLRAKMIRTDAMEDSFGDIPIYLALVRVN